MNPLSMPPTDTTTRTLPSLHEFFAPGGILARSPLPYEYRPGQLEMAKAVERAFSEHRHLIVEAGTGTGKTLAYLLPALRTGQRVIVSTGTKALQDQLFFRDMPFLETLLGDLRVCYMKGRANYLCRHKLFALRDQPMLSGLEEIDEYRQIAEWEQITETGDRAELAGLPESSALWHKLDARSDACIGNSARTTAAASSPRCAAALSNPTSSSSITTCSSPTLPCDRWPPAAPDAGILPEAGAVIFDEAHELEEVASSYFGLSVSNLRFEELARDTEVLLRGKQGTEKIPGITQQLRDRARMFFAALAAGGDGRQPFSDREQFLETSGDLYLGVRATLRQMEAEIDGLSEVDEAPAFKARAARLRTELEFMLESNASNMVYWLERRGGGGNTPVQRSAPRSARSANHLSAGHAHRRLGAAARARLRADSHRCAHLGHAHRAGRLRAHPPAGSGSTEARELVVPSHFRYGEQALLYLPPEMPDPRDAEFPEAAARCIRRVLEHHARPRLLPLHQLQPDAHSLRAAAAGARFPDPAAWHGSAQGAA